jgi:tRNA (cytidine/uridine-2'-O-)-methyltransferase
MDGTLKVRVGTSVNKNLPKTKSPQLKRHVVLVSPQIHWNTGNIGRTCVATGSDLHLIRPLGFSLDSKELKRAGLDYWKQVKLRIWDDLEDLNAKLKPRQDEVAIFSKTGRRPFWSLPSPSRLFLIFGSETRGLPASLMERYPEATYHIPITQNIRSLNLSTAVAIALYESLRLANPFHAWSIC